MGERTPLRTNLNHMQSPGLRKFCYFACFICELQYSTARCSLSRKIVKRCSEQVRYIYYLGFAFSAARQSPVQLACDHEEVILRHPQSTHTCSL